MTRLFVVLAIVTAAASSRAQQGPRTWRVDFYQTGGPGVETYSLDRILVEPLPWPGHPGTYVDRTDTGNYRYEVLDQQGTVVFSRPFDPVFWEWLTTSEAQTVRRTFHESLRFPAPSGKSHVIVRKRNTRGAYDEVWRLNVDPDDIFVDRSVSPRHEPIQIERHGDPPAKVDVLLLGDGYTTAECTQKFAADTRRMTEALFALEPFRSRRTDFNVWGLCPPAAESGIARPSTGIYRRSPAGATYDAFGAERYILTFENRAWRDIAAWAPYEFVTILTNTRTYGGGGLFNVYSTAAVDNDWADYLFVHEFAHHFTGLADEYYTSPAVYEPPKEIVEPWPSNVTAVAELDRLKWRDLVTPDVPVPTPWPKEEFEARSKAFQERRMRIRAENRPEEEMSALFREEQAATTKLLGSAESAGKVGAFRGANYDAQAFYRPEIDCIMFTRNKVPFCRACQRALAQTIDRHVMLRTAR
jgi:hypothetical protein